MEQVLTSIGFGIDYIIALGASVMIPFIIAVLSICIGVKPGRAVRSGLFVGVGLVGMGLIITMINTSMGPATAQMGEALGVSLSVVDIGWPGMSPITWSSVISTIAIPLAVAINLIMFFTRLTKVLNIDIWNVWHMAFTGAVAYAVTGNFWIGLLGVAVHAVIAYKLGDLWAPLMEDYFGLQGITVPHGDSAYMAPLAAFVDEVIEKIPGIRKVNFSIKGLQSKIGVWGEPVIIGFILGTIVGLLAGYEIKEALILGVQMAAVMVLMPRIVKCIMEGLTPISERAKEIMHKSNKKNPREFYIGMDPAILLGDSEVIAAGILFIPITLLIAILMPGNTVLPCGDLATIGFFIAIAVAVHKGNLFRTLISGTLIMIMTIWITNQTVGWTTAMAEMVGYINPGEGLISSLDQGGAPITYIFVELFNMDNIPGLIGIAVLYGGTYFFAVAHSRKRKKALVAANAAAEAKAAPAPAPKPAAKKPAPKKPAPKKPSPKKKA